MPKVTTKSNRASNFTPLDVASVNLSEMTLDSFKLWSMTSLKAFLCVRSKSTGGSFDELVARAYVAYEENIPVNSQQEHKVRSALDEYKRKLVVGDVVLPDPFTLKSGWVNEDTGIKLWPSIYLTDMVAYLNLTTPAELISRLLNEYKQGKAYRYYAAGWVQGILYHPVQENSPVCLLSTRVKPTMHSAVKPYEVWVSAAKQTPSVAGGEIFSAYCTCVAGLHGTCNHVCGLLFRVEEAVKSGLNMPSCTSLPCQWNKPTAFKPSAAVMLSSSLMQKHNYNTSVNTFSHSVRKLATEFTSLLENWQSPIKNQSTMRQELADVIREVKPDSCFLQIYDMRGPVGRNSGKKVPLPPLEVAKSLASTEGADAKPEMLLQHMLLTREQAANITAATTAQSASNDWQQQRIGRCTASISKRIITRTATLEKDPSTSTDKLVESILKYKPIHPTRAMKHGLSMEPKAKAAFHRVTRKSHKKFCQADTGLHVLPTKPFVAGSPDLLVSCDCHGEGICEIKCPLIEGGKLTADTYGHLQQTGDTLMLSRNSEYYYQVQHLMGVTGRQYCYFFCYTPFDSHSEVIRFDETMWNSMLLKHTKFWMTCVAPELLSGRLSRALDVHKSLSCEHAYSSVSVNNMPGTSGLQMPVEVRSVLDNSKLPSMYLCRLCGTMLPDNQDTCSSCNRYY